MKKWLNISKKRKSKRKNKMKNIKRKWKKEELEGKNG